MARCMHAATRLNQHTVRVHVLGDSVCLYVIYITSRAARSGDGVHVQRDLEIDQALAILDVKGAVGVNKVQIARFAMPF